MISAYILVKLAPHADLTKVAHALQEPGFNGLDMTLGPQATFVRCFWHLTRLVADLAPEEQRAWVRRDCRRALR